jgi:hypothetical protein
MAEHQAGAHPSHDDQRSHPAGHSAEVGPVGLQRRLTRCKQSGSATLAFGDLGEKRGKGVIAGDPRARDLGTETAERQPLAATQLPGAQVESDLVNLGLETGEHAGSGRKDRGRSAWGRDDETSRGE